MNSIQKAMTESYPNGDLPPFDLNDPAQVEAAVDRHGTGDTLFEFIFKELPSVDSAEVALDRMSRATDDVQTVMDALNAMSLPLPGPR